jgi:hypothetical protein
MTEPTEPSTEPTELSRDVAASTRLARGASANVVLSEAEGLTVEFRIQDLVRKLVPEGELAAFCGGCNGCMGCSM